MKNRIKFYFHGLIFLINNDNKILVLKFYASNCNVSAYGEDNFWDEINQ
jgi:hypothetical protein